MLALRFEQKGLEHLRLAEHPRIEPATGELLIRVRAAGLNRSDVSNVIGNHAYTTLPRTPGRDFAGVVEHGPAPWQGVAVWGSGREIGFTRDGSHAEFLLIAADAVARKPERLSFEEAACCGVPYITASLALRAVSDSDRLLVIGAAGAVGSAAVDLARLRHIDVAGATRDSEWLRDGVIQGQWDAIFDTTGHWLAQSIAALNRGGKVIVIYSPGNGRQEISSRDLYRREASIIGVNSLLHPASDCARMLDALVPHFESGALRPPSGIESWPLSKAVQAYGELHQGRKGKLVIVPEAGRV